MAQLKVDQLADYLLCEARQRGVVLTHQKLQKLCYYAQAWWLVLYEEPLIDEDFQAWVPGPVLVSQQKRFGAFRCNPIVHDLTPSEITEPVRRHLDEILTVFGADSEDSLERMVCEEAPWIKARGDLSRFEISTSLICKDAIRVYYASLE